jgi:hypothetical protein
MFQRTATLSSVPQEAGAEPRAGYFVHPVMVYRGLAS